MNELETMCPLERVIEMIDGKWTVLILWHLRTGPLRFSELERKLKKATHKVLAQQLRRLEESGLIERRAYPEVPVRVEYSLSSKGEELKPLLLMLNEWGWSYFRSKA